MSLQSSKPILEQALKKSYAVGAFNFSNLEVLQGILLGAQKAHAPVILSATEGACSYAGMQTIVAMVKSMNEQFENIPFALHLDHGQSVEICKKAIDAGFSSVMIDASKHSFEKNISMTKEVVSYAQLHGVAVEAELGRIVGIEDTLVVENSDAVFTDPQKAREFVERTGCDFLAVSIGTSHGAYKFEGEAHLDITRLQMIQESIPNTPLVLHGASEVPEEIITKANMYGASLTDAHGVSEDILKTVSALNICKINTDTDIRLVMLEAIREHLAEYPENIDMRKYLGVARDRICDFVQQKLTLLGASNQA